MIRKVPLLCACGNETNRLMRGGDVQPQGEGMGLGVRGCESAGCPVVECLAVIVTRSLASGWMSKIISEGTHGSVVVTEFPSARPGWKT